MKKIVTLILVLTFMAICLPYSWAGSSGKRQQLGVSYDNRKASYIDNYYAKTSNQINKINSLNYNFNRQAAGGNVLRAEGDHRQEMRANILSNIEQKYNKAIGITNQSYANFQSRINSQYNKYLEKINTSYAGPDSQLTQSRLKVLDKVYTLESNWANNKYERVVNRINTTYDNRLRRVNNAFDYLDNLHSGDPISQQGLRAKN